MIFGITILLSGCLGGNELPAVSPEEFFCNQTENFRWSQGEWDRRVSDWPLNLRREIQINERRLLWCSQNSNRIVH